MCPAASSLNTQSLREDLVMSSISTSSNSEDLQKLREHPLVKDYASVDADLYELIKATNPTLRMLIDLSKNIVNGGGK